MTDVLRRGRASLAFSFFAQGAAFALLVTRIPAIQDRYGDLRRAAAGSSWPPCRCWPGWAAWRPSSWSSGCRPVAYCGGRSPSCCWRCSVSAPGTQVAEAGGGAGAVRAGRRWARRLDEHARGESAAGVRAQHHARLPRRVQPGRDRRGLAGVGRGRTGISRCSCPICRWWRCCCRPLVAGPVVRRRERGGGHGGETRRRVAGRRVRFGLVFRMLLPLCLVMTFAYIGDSTVSNWSAKYLQDVLGVRSSWRPSRTTCTW